MIDSGGIKIQIEEVEHLLKSSLTDDFAITSCPDERFGEAVVLLTTQGNTKCSQNTLPTTSSKVWQPRFIFHVPTLPQTGNGKPARAEIKALARQLCDSIA